MAEQYTYLRCVSDNATTLTVVPPGAGTFAQKLTFNFSFIPGNYNSSYFSQYDGDGVSTLYRFPIDSNLVITGIKLSIPNLPGARFAHNPNGTLQAIEQGYGLYVRAWNQLVTVPGTSANYFVGINQLGEWVPTNIFLSAAFFQAGNNLMKWITISLGASGHPTIDTFVDFRNYQTVFDGIKIYMLAELQVIAPQGVY